MGGSVPKDGSLNGPVAGRIPRLCTAPAGATLLRSCALPRCSSQLLCRPPTKHPLAPPPAKDVAQYADGGLSGMAARPQRAPAASRARRRGSGLLRNGCLLPARKRWVRCGGPRGCILAILAGAEQPASCASRAGAPEASTGSCPPRCVELSALLGDSSVTTWHPPNLAAAEKVLDYLQAVDPDAAARAKVAGRPPR